MVENGLWFDYSADNGDYTFDAIKTTVPDGLEEASMTEITEKLQEFYRDVPTIIHLQYPQDIGGNHTSWVELTPLTFEWAVNELRMGDVVFTRTDVNQPPKSGKSPNGFHPMPDGHKRDIFKTRYTEAYPIQPPCSSFPANDLISWFRNPQTPDKDKLPPERSPKVMQRRVVALRSGLLAPNQIGGLDKLALATMGGSSLCRIPVRLCPGASLKYNCAWTHVLVSKDETWGQLCRKLDVLSLSTLGVVPANGQGWWISRKPYVFETENHEVLDQLIKPIAFQLQDSGGERPKLDSHYQWWVPSPDRKLLEGPEKPLSGDQHRILLDRPSAPVIALHHNMPRRPHWQKDQRPDAGKATEETSASGKTDGETYPAELKAAEERHAAELKAADERHAAELKAARERHATELQSLEDASKAKDGIISTLTKEKQDAIEGAEIKRKNAIEAMTQDINQMTDEKMDAMKAKVTEKDALLKKNADALALLKVEMAGKDATIAEKDAEIKEKDAMIKKYGDAIQHKDATVFQLKEALNNSDRQDQQSEGSKQGGGSEAPPYESQPGLFGRPMTHEQMTKYGKNGELPKEPRPRKRQKKAEPEYSEPEYYTTKVTAHVDAVEIHDVAGDCHRHDVKLSFEGLEKVYLKPDSVFLCVGGAWLPVLSWQSGFGSRGGLAKLDSSHCSSLEKGKDVGAILCYQTK